MFIYTKSNKTEGQIIAAKRLLNIVQEFGIHAFSVQCIKFMYPLSLLQASHLIISNMKWKEN